MLNLISFIALLYICIKIRDPIIKKNWYVYQQDIERFIYKCLKYVLAILAKIIRALDTEVESVGWRSLLLGQKIITDTCNKIKNRKNA
jgi:hypothetical protein